MPDFRIPRGYARKAWPFQERMADGTRPSYPLRPAKFLPVADMDLLHQDAVVLIPGTWVGVLNDTDNSDVPAVYRSGVGQTGFIVPACPVSYTVTYSAKDLADAEGSFAGTPDLDDADGAVVAAAGASTTAVGVVKPVGVVTHPYYAGWLPDAYQNYDRQLKVTWLSGGAIIRVPAVTANEAAIQAGDLVMLDDAATPTHDPYAASPTSPGRIEAWDGGALADVEFVVGRCVQKVLLGRQGSVSAGEMLRTTIGTGAPRSHGLDTTPSLLWPEGTDFEMNSKVETVPGLGLSSSSATLGRPSELLFARADADGNFWALDILVRV